MRLWQGGDGMKKDYEAPMIEIEAFEIEDIIAASGADNTAFDAECACG